MTTLESPPASQPPDLIALSPAPAPASRIKTPLWSLPLRAILALLRLAIAILCCTSYLLSLLVLGWTRRWMRRAVARRWFKSSPRAASLSFHDWIAAEQLDLPRSAPPRWFVCEAPDRYINRPTRSGQTPGTLRKSARWLASRFGSLAIHLRSGLELLACNAVLLLPVGLIWLFAWEYGWNVSFNKQYEQSFIGLLTGLTGILLFMLAMTYVPLAGAHLAATNDPRAFFDLSFIRRLYHARPLAMLLFAAAVVALSLPASFLWCAVLFYGNSLPQEIASDPAKIRQLTESYVFWSAVYILPAYLITHLLAARIYAGSVLHLLKQDPALSERLHPEIESLLRILNLLEPRPKRSWPLVVQAVLVTGRAGSHLALRAAAFLVWIALALQPFIMQFLHYHTFIPWLNPVLVNLPCLRFFPAGPG
jgi:hypothetical protein